VRDTWCQVPWDWLSLGGAVCALLCEHATMYRSVMLRSGPMIPSPPRPETPAPLLGHPMWDAMGRWSIQAQGTCMACGVFDTRGHRGGLVRRYQQVKPTAPAAHSGCAMGAYSSPRLSTTR